MIKPYANSDGSMKASRLLRYIDLIFCLIVLPAIIAIFPVERWAQNFPLYSIGVGVWLYALYFLNRSVVVPGLIKSDWKSPVSWGLIVVSLAVSVALASVDLFDRDYSQFDEGLFVFLPRLKMYQQAVMCWFVVVEAFSFMVGLVDESYRQRIAMQEIEAAHDREVITQLLNRIRPHFLFNTLNTLYGLFLTENPAALPSLAKFISMLQYIHRASDTLLVPLSDEVQYIREYIDLQSLRLNGKTKVMFEVDIENDALQIPPLLLVTFVENCFKYGVSSIEETCIRISVEEESGILTFRTENRVFSDGRSGGHDGLANCRRRLAVGFPDRHTLNITDDGMIFTVLLTITY